MIQLDRLLDLLLKLVRRLLDEQIQSFLFIEDQIHGLEHKEDTEGRATAARAHLEAWRVRRAQIIELGSKASRTIQTATERARSASTIVGSGDITLVDARW